MSLAGVNRAVTADGEPYNKLRRPDQLLGPLAASLVSKDIASTSPPAAGADKRKREDDEGNDLSENVDVHIKRPRVNAVPTKPAKTRNNRKIQDAPGRLPVSDGECSSDDECTIQARAFLRSAREEERTLNRALLLVDAPKEAYTSESDHSTSDHRRRNQARYKDGYYFARELQSPEYYQQEPSELQPQEQYYKTFLKRYNAIRKTLANHGLDRAGNLSGSNNTVPPSNRREWLYILNREYPTPAQACQLDDYNIARGLKYCAHDMDRSDTITKQKSCWIWTLLAKAGEVDTMLSEGVSPIRELAIKAGKLGIRIRGAAMQALEADDEDAEAENWEVGNMEMDYEGSEHSSDDDRLGLRDEDCGTPQSDVGRTEEEIIEPLERTTTSLETANTEPEPKHDDSADSGADMSMSEEGEVQDDAEPTTLEEARARLLAQLGDRLVQPQANSHSQEQTSEQKSPLKVTSRRSSSPPLRQPASPGATRHRHNGKACYDPTCTADERRRASHQKAGLRAAQGKGTPPRRSASPPERLLPSRAEAEAQRQAMREKELTRVNSENSADGGATIAKPEEEVKTNSVYTEELSKTSQKVFSSRSEAEDYRQKQRKFEAVQNAESTQHSAAHDDAEMTEDELADLNTRATIDMILTITIECYGQKDLLQYRQSWVQ